jgi:hypothetical protein
MFRHSDYETIDNEWYIDLAFLDTYIDFVMHLDIIYI